MASLYVEEYRSLLAEGDPSADIPAASGEIPVGREARAARSAVNVLGTLVAAQAPITIAGASAQSAAFNADTQFVVLVADTACHILFGANPTVDTDDRYLPANVPREFIAVAGQKVAVIAH